jgi:hypothetical protein
MALHMSHLRLAHLFETMYLDQVDNPTKARSHVGRENLEFIPNASVEQFGNPRRPSVLHFCNTPWKYAEQANARPTCYHHALGVRNCL